MSLERHKINRSQQLMLWDLCDDLLLILAYFFFILINLTNGWRFINLNYIKDNIKFKLQHKFELWSFFVCESENHNRRFEDIYLSRVKRYAIFMKLSCFYLIIEKKSGGFFLLKPRKKLNNWKVVKLTCNDTL